MQDPPHHTNILPDFCYANAAGVIELIETIGHCDSEAAEVWDRCAEGRGLSVVEAFALAMPACVITLLSKTV